MAGIDMSILVLSKKARKAIKAYRGAIAPALAKWDKINAEVTRCTLRQSLFESDTDYSRRLNKHYRPREVQYENVNALRAKAWKTLRDALPMLKKGHEFDEAYVNILFNGLPTTRHRLHDAIDRDSLQYDERLDDVIDDMIACGLIIRRK